MSESTFGAILYRHPVRWRALCLSLGALGMLLLLLPLFWSFAGRSFHMLLENYNEGWNALYIDRVNAGATLYPGADELLLNNYPPLSFLLVAGVAKLTGSAMVAGRLVSVAAFLAVAGLIGLIVARRTGRAAGLFAGAFFGLSFACFPGQRIGLNDPQLLAHALMLAGLAAVWLAPHRLGNVAAGAALMVLGGMTKHNLIAIPLATTAWMLWQGRRPARRWLTAAGLSGAVGLLFMLVVGGAPMLQSMLAPRHVSLAHGIALCRKLLALSDIPLLVAVLGLSSIRRRSDLVFAGLLLAFGLLEMLLFAGGDGVVANVAYDLLVAQAIALGLAMATMQRPAIAAALLVFYFALVLPVDQVKEALAGNPTRAARERLVEADVSYIAARNGPALCFDPALCWYAGRPPEYDPFNMGQQFSLGLRSPDLLTDRFVAKRYAVVELSGEAVDGTSYALPRAAQAALTANYRVDRRSEDRVFLVPLP